MTEGRRGGGVWEGAERRRRECCTGTISLTEVPGRSPVVRDGGRRMEREKEGEGGREGGRGSRRVFFVNQVNPYGQ